MTAKPVPFGKYYLLHRVDTGGMAEVFRAKAFGVEGFERIVAVKRILPNIAADTDFITMFIDEAKLAVQLTHANIAQIFDLGRVDDSYFIALEYVHGKDLRAVFEHARRMRRVLPVELVCYVLMKICEGLDYAHEKRDAEGEPLGLVHRDVSPQNMLISFEGDVKLIDFGLAKAANKASRTRAGVLKGKFGYLSPEQVRNEPVDRRSDVFGVGIVLYELLTGERLFAGDGDFSILEKVRNVEVPDPRYLNPKLPEELAQIVLRALAGEPEQRYASALELHDALQGFLHTLGAPFHRKELSAWMLGQFPDEAARDLEQVGELEGADSLAFQPNDVTPSVEPTESSAVYKETRDAPEEAKPKQPATILGMPAVLPPADLAPTPGRSPLPPPPPRAGGGTRPPAPPGAGRSVPPPPPRAGSQPPMVASQLRNDGSSPALPAPLSPSNLPGSRSVPPPPPGPATLSGGGQGGQRAMLSMDWDDEELSTQIYDRPNDDYESIEAGYDELAGDRGQDDGYGQAYEQQPQYAQGGYSEPYPAQSQTEPDPFSPAGVHVSPRAYANSEPPPRVEPISSFRAPAATQTMTTMTADRLGDRRNPLYAALAVAAVVLLCFVGYVFLSRTEPGMVQLTTHPADAVLLFDGKQVGTASPFVVTGVSPNEKHLIEVKKPGYRSWSQEVQVQASQTLQFPVTLQTEGGGETAVAVGASGSAQTGGFSVESSPAGAAVFLDGQALSGVTPLRVANLLPRAYELRIKLPGFREHKSRVDVRAGVDRSLSRVVLDAERVRVRIASEPSGSEAVLVRGSDRRTLGRTPLDVTLDNDGSPWIIEVSKSGYESFSQSVSAEAGAAELTVRAVLARRERSSDEPSLAASEPPRSSHSGSGSSASGSGHSSSASPSSSGTSSGSGSRASSSASANDPEAGGVGGQGTLRINSRPWSQVFVDGRNIGNTPQMNVALPAGTHKVMLVNPEFNLRKSLSITIRPGQVETQIIALQ